VDQEAPAEAEGQGGLTASARAPLLAQDMRSPRFLLFTDSVPKRTHSLAGRSCVPGTQGDRDGGKLRVGIAWALPEQVIQAEEVRRQERQVAQRGPKLPTGSLTVTVGCVDDLRQRRAGGLRLRPPEGRLRWPDGAGLGQRAGVLHFAAGWQG